LMQILLLRAVLDMLMGWVQTLPVIASRFLSFFILFASYYLLYASSISRKTSVKQVS
jgi:hypothetical protein